LQDYVYSKKLIRTGILESTKKDDFVHSLRAEEGGMHAVLNASRRTMSTEHALFSLITKRFILACVANGTAHERCGCDVKT
jgi:hypothetical protein